MWYVKQNRGYVRQCHKYWNKTDTSILENFHNFCNFTKITNTNTCTYFSYQVKLINEMSYFCNFTIFSALTWLTHVSRYARLFSLQIGVREILRMLGIPEVDYFVYRLVWPFPSTFQKPTPSSCKSLTS